MMAVDSPPGANKRRNFLRQLPVLDEKCLLEQFKEKGIQELHAANIWRHIIQKDVADFQDIPDLPKSAYALLREKFTICSSKLIESHESADESTMKLLIQLHDGKSVEAVIMRYGTVELSTFPEDIPKAKHPSDRKFKSNQRATLCVSSQVGCQMGCTFCATGTMGLSANLTAGEILEQLYIASKFHKIRNVVFMGMGEPLDNYEEVLTAIRGMNDIRRFNISSHRITVSTVGVAPRIKQLANDFPGVSLALSLHAPNEELRSKLVPTSKAWPIKKIMQATDLFISKQRALTQTMMKNQVIMFEYVLIADVNDSSEIAHELGELLSARKDYVMLNVIPYNPTDVPMNYSTPDRKSIDTFVATVRSHGITTTLRQEFGTDIAGACGQLVVQKQLQPQDGVASTTREIENIASNGHVRRSAMNQTPPPSYQPNADAAVSGNTKEDAAHGIEDSRNSNSTVEIKAVGNKIYNCWGVCKFFNFRGFLTIRMLLPSVSLVGVTFVTLLLLSSIKKKHS